MRPDPLERVGWGERLALIEHFQLTDMQALNLFKIRQEDLDTAREMVGTVIPKPEEVDYEKYEKIFVEKGVYKSSDTTAYLSPTDVKPITASKPKKEPKKRGRKGTKILDAFNDVPSEPTPVEQFAAKHGIAVSILRQSKRFDKSGKGGMIHIKRDRETGVRMIWRAPY